MKLFVDDIRNAPDDSWIVARTVTDAIRAIARFRDDISEISLDHDISHQVSVGPTSRPYPCAECFCAVAYYIAIDRQGDAHTPLSVKIHTANPVGAKEMQQILEDAGVKATIEPYTPTNRFELET